MHNGVCPACGSDGVEVVGDTIWCEECGELICDTGTGQTTNLSWPEARIFTQGDLQYLASTGPRVSREELPCQRVMRLPDRLDARGFGILFSANSVVSTARRKVFMLTVPLHEARAPG